MTMGTSFPAWPGFNLNNNPGKFDNPQVIGGLKVGTWFVKEGVLGYNYPDWMKYLGFYIDFSYQRLNIKSGGTSLASDFFQGVTGGGTTPNMLTSEGFAATLAFMFAGRYAS